MRAAILALVTGVLLAGTPACGGGDEGANETVGEDSVRALPACAGADPASPAPELPVDFPLPPGTAIVSSESPFPSQVVVAALVPGELPDAAAYFNDVLPEDGYEVGIGDAEGTESEAPFTGNGYRGKWRLNSIPECDAVRLTLVLIEQA